MREPVRIIATVGALPFAIRRRHVRSYATLRKAMWHDRSIAAAELAGRVLLGFLFMHEAWSKLAALGAATAYMQAYGLPAWLLPFAIALELGAGLFVAIGFLTRIAALALAVFCLVAAVVFHSNFGDRGQMIHFLKDLALAGAFLILAARGAGPLSIAALWVPRQHRI